ncbi:cytochrome c biogenesis protein CCS1, chloroplastic [Nicotiana tomentosiformis]|uniref:cytochrome c biogenesis protein CCS1, chloroplastic n=1 Tax=Nicotiana tomentosiformis TaxID=4098 RepID=UPI00051C39C4|nr:cytochrome c biogenesis protein CCS1, chloroplastic [Nicotiana tomentosiformis]
METLKISTTPSTMSHIQNQIHPLNLKPYPLIRNSRILGVYNNKGGRTFSFTLTCKLKVKTVKGTKTNNEKSFSGQITVPDSDSAPPIIEAEEGSIGNGEKKVEQKNSVSGSGLLKKLPRKFLGILSNLPLAIAEMFAVAGLMALGTFIDQGEAPDYYFQKFPDDHPSLGFFSWRWVLTLGFDHMFSSPVFLGTLTLLGASLMACTYTTQIPLVKVARRWSFLNSAETIRKQEYADTLPRASVKDLGVILMGDGYEVFSKGPALYAFKGLAGRFAPIGVHLSLLLVMSGGTLSATGSFRGAVTVPQGLNFVAGDVLSPSGFLSTPSDAFSTEIHVNRFSMDYYDSGEVSQFHTDLSLYDLNGKEVMRKTISVNDPLRYGGITIYQTDWSISALQVLKDGEGPFNLAMAPLQMNGGDKKLFGTFLPVEDGDSPNVKGISMLARDLQSVILYDKQGKFAGVRRPNSKLPIEIDGTKIVIVDAIGSSGLDLKTDPGVPVVYAGFGALMLTTCISYLSHTQLWALQDGTSVVVGGKTNRAKGEFPDAINRLLDQVPELVESSSSKESDSLMASKSELEQTGLDV